MDRDTFYVSSIPVEAREKITQTWGDRSRKRAEYYIKKELVGIRTFFRTGELETELPFQAGVVHGMTYRWEEPGKLLCCEPAVNGKAHGTAYQWGRNGRLIGSYTMEHGTGIDLWWGGWDDGSAVLTEVRYYQDGERHGYEWWFSSQSLWWERHWVQGKQHGIERRWNHKRGLKRGYPQYYVHRERVTKRQYVKACAADSTLPPFRPEDNRPQRVFPPEVAAALQKET